MCLHTKSIQSGSVCRLHVVDQFYDTLTLGVVCLSEVIVVKFYILWRIFVCILESIDDEFVALVALVETLLFLAVGLWLAKYRRYE